ncbi:DUF4652 domain-containing protein [Clostridium tagluense]|uniref:DUF4652 domain-containing protein n=1 Tax=Clostridium tagluense TaxID=360422 RepID=UPI001C6E881B|nr:DUF4652 domain-containing protein [Clostridium tagluense]MBW9157552.1 DUF4652 domain-containing protein [Clostridium tagluense]WLC65397.1 DUF4652 domain-containing protein [Clostridium tagluense]
MNCNIFKKGLGEYVLGNISNDLKIAIEKHMDGCESCRRLYEEEIKIDRDFKMVLSIDGIEFNRSRASIINSIDKNRYSKKTSNKILYNFKKYKNRYLSYAVAAMAMIVIIPMMLKGFGGVNFNNATSKKTTVINNSSEKEASKKSDTLIGHSSLAMDFKSSIITKQALLDYKMNWKNSGDGKRSAAIDIKPERDVDFGIHAAYIKNMTTNEIVKYEVINNERQYTPMLIEWWDSEHLIIVAGFGEGTIEYGSEVYSLDVNTGQLSTIYKEADGKHQILDFKKVKNDLIFQLLIYNDDTYNTFHKGVGKMTLLELDKLVNMETISEEK